MLRIVLMSVAAVSVLFSWYFWRPYQDTWLHVVEQPVPFPPSPPPLSNKSIPPSSLPSLLSPSPSPSSLRPTSSITVIQFNIDHGGEARKEAVLAWLLHQSADVVGFCEANKWQYNLSNIASAAGYSYSEIFPTQHGYPLAVFSKTSIKVIGQHEEHFERGVLHVQILGIHFFIAHLNAHSSAARELETMYLANLVRNVNKAHLPAKQKISSTDVTDGNGLLLTSFVPVVVMGDMNTLSFLDNEKLQNTTIENQPLLQALSSLACYKAMKKKFLLGPNFDQFNYKPMDHLLEAGLVDTSSQRQPTEPTDISCDQARNCVCPHLRLDYMLVSKQFATIPTSNVIANTETNQLSDHFPIELRIVV